ncbi:hypothetical protein L596_016524 [Steinernema carpocapsae]|uniref:Nematode cuticle collagen N-terminal domain-containing protein n=1 Tax=Steinernema carpocapsae TaxID=34508 RepID=A0A4U5NJ72_STECR|nr:hypothetical protein L596_016524 [Steinernema carpocapsae]
MVASNDEKLRIQECEGLKKIAFVGVTISTVATLVCVLSVPMVYNYMQRVQTVLQNEVDFCKSRSGNIWREVTRTQVMSQFNGGVRHLRQAGYEGPAGVEAPAPQAVPAVAPSGGGHAGGGGGCCGCGVSGPGQPGAPGPDGQDGEDGAPGAPGKDGPDAPPPAPPQAVVSY